MMDMNVIATLDQIDAEEAALVAQVIALRGRKAEARERELGSAIEQAQALINRYGITNDKLTFPAQPSIPMYRDLLSDETWSGKGNAPLWAKDKPLEQFLNPEWVAKKVKEEQAKAEREAKKVERVEKKAEKEAAKAKKCSEQIAGTGANQTAGAARQPVVTKAPTATNEANAPTLFTSGAGMKAEAIGHHDDAESVSMNEKDMSQQAGGVVVADVTSAPMVTQYAPAVVAA
ncbi:H-NS family nucleoid-associated regulatory protein [Burkholderia pseudomallei]|uniref:H-NS family nucleoid-associated regulatory protein n=1 Tax=Burkholderia pseudomallei TaxID=28450 RepID=UPI000537A5FA|nr:H-NS family nucleoid-associated regulatory protein [Burkholderia pseudomallei]KGW92089.1 H-NS histone family protein [Burkholderia pseudomallei MSHR456]